MSAMVAPESQERHVAAEASSPAPQGPHVWIVNQYALPRGSTGITRHGDLASVMRRSGLAVTVVSSTFDNFQRGGRVAHGVAPVTNHDGVRFVWLDTSSYKTNGVRRVLNMVEFYLRATLSRLATRVGKPDVVVGSSPHLLSALAGLHLARMHGARFVLELRDVWPEDLVAMGALRDGSPMHRALHALARHLERQADRIVTVPPKLAGHMVDRGVPSEKIVFIPNGVFLEDEALRPEPLPASLETELNAVAGHFVVMYMGAHGEANGLGNVLDAAELLRAQHPDERVAFVLVGAGQQKDELMARAAAAGLENVRFHPPIPKRAVSTAAARADAMLVNFAPADTFSAYGRSPNKLYDYLSAGKPVLFSTTDDTTILDRERAGLTFTPGSPRALADAALTLARMTPEQRAAMGERGRGALAGSHDLATLGTTLAGVVRELTAQ